MSPQVAELAGAVIAALNSGEPERIEPLLHPGVEIVTGRNVHSGREAAMAWAGKEFDNLLRRYAVDDLRVRSGSVLAVGSVQYVWKDGGEVADSSPIALELELAGSSLRRLVVHDDAATALAAFSS